MISPTPTHPVTAGNRARVGSLARSLQRMGHEVHFALGSVAQPDLAAMRELFGEGLHVLRCREPYSIGGFLPRLRRKLLKIAGSEAGHLWSLDEYYDSGLTPQIAALCARERFDAAIVEYVFMSKAFDAVAPGTVRILDTHDRFALRHRNFLQAGQAPQWFSTSVAEETEGLRRAHYVLAIQEQEAAAFAEQLGSDADRVLTVGHLVDVQESSAQGTAPGAVFLASGNSINVDAANYFIDEVLPRIKQCRPDFRFWLAGDVGAALADTPAAVVRLGQVKAVADAFGHASLAVNPVRMGTGLNIKMLDALACGAACVSSEAGSRGLERYRGVAFESVADNDAVAMADTILRLLADPQRQAQLRETARRTAEQWNRSQIAGLARILRAADGSIRRGDVWQ